MKRILQRMWREENGTLSFEWITLTTLLTIGAVGGLASVRDAITDEMADMTEAIVSLDQSYAVPPPLVISVHDRAATGGTQVQVRNFRSTGPGVGVQVPAPVRKAVSSGGAGSLYLDSRPNLTREGIGQPPQQAEPNPLQGDL